MTMERDLSSGTLENVSLSEDGQASSHMPTVPTMGGSAIANPMAPAFPHSNPVSNSQQINSSVQPSQKEATPGMMISNRPNSLPQPNCNAAGHSYSAPNSLTSPGK